MDDVAISASDCPLASIVVTCKGRLHHLRRTLPCMLAQECSFGFEVVVVDFGCPQGTFDWCRSLDVRKLVALKVLDDTDDFHLSRARNCGAKVARGRILAFVDADIFVEANWLDAATGALRQGRGGLGTVGNAFQTGWERGGTCVVSAEIFHAVRGYDEALRGWGCEDTDFYARASARTATCHFPAFLLTPIRHGDTERVSYQSAKEIAESSARNSQSLAGRTAPINPQGYGRGEFTIFRGQGSIRPAITWVKRQRIVRPVRRCI